jgi:hypothetical protein
MDVSYVFSRIESDKSHHSVNQTTLLMVCLWLITSFPTVFICRRLHLRQQKGHDIGPGAKVASLPTEHMLHLHTHLTLVILQWLNPQPYRKEMRARM